MSTENDLDPHSEAIRAVEAEFGDLISQFRRLVARNAQRVADGMLPGAYKVFTVIVRHGPVTSAALAERMMFDKGQMSRTVRYLEDLGLVTRSPDPDDRRAVLLEATEEGKRRLEAAREPDGHKLFDTLRTWRVDEIRQLARLLHALTHGDEPGEDPSRDGSDTDHSDSGPGDTAEAER